MFNFLGKSDYTTKCTKILNNETGLDPLIAQAFIEDFKPIFDEEYEKNNPRTFAGMYQFWCKKI